MAEHPLDPPAAAGRRRDGLLLVLTAAAGCADAIGFLALGHIFTANMSGNTVLLGLHAARGDGAAALRSLVALGGFAAGLAVGTLIGDRPRGGRVWPVSVTRALLVEAAILAAVAMGAWATGPFDGGAAGYALIALSAIAMGMQSAAAWRLDVPGISTTYLTGTLTSAVTGFVSAPRPAARGTAPAAADATARRLRVHLQFLALGFYGLGAAAGGLTQLRWPAAVNLLPLAAVAAVVAAVPWVERGAPVSGAR